jgi:valyl-tRNA synthetase
MLKAYADKLEAQIVAQEKVVSQLQGRLDNKGYVAHAPKEIVKQTKEQLADAKSNLERLKVEQTRFQAA